MASVRRAGAAVRRLPLRTREHRPFRLARRAQVRSATGNARLHQRRAATVARLTATVIHAPLLLHSTLLAETADVIPGTGSLQRDRFLQDGANVLMQVFDLRFG